MPGHHRVEVRVDGTLQYGIIALTGGGIETSHHNRWLLKGCMKEKETEKEKKLENEEYKKFE